MKWLGQTLLRGLVTVLPIVLSITFFVWLGTTTESLLAGLAGWLLPDVLYVPGLGIAVAVLLLLLAGVLMRAVLARRLFAALEASVMEIPLLRTIYGSLKDLLGFFAEDGMRRNLSRVVEVPFAATGQTALGFVTSERPAALPAGDPRIAVYVPMSYQIGGFTLFVDPEDVRELGIGVEDALRFAMTAGVTRDDRSPLQAGP